VTAAAGAGPAHRLVALDVPSAIAHRGGSRLAPENTLAAFERAAALGVDAIECDVQLSRDDEVVVIHDATLDRTTDASGPVRARTADELARVDAGSRFVDEAGRRPFAGMGIGVPRLAEVLARWPSVPFVIEIKGTDVRAAGRVAAVIAEAGAADRVVIGGFDDAVLRAARRALPGVPSSASLAEVKAALRRSFFFQRPRPTGYQAFQVPRHYRGRRVATRPFVRRARAAGVAVHVWVVDAPADIRRLAGWGVTGFISDRPDVVIEELGGVTARSTRR
jgi:glycerophosphoryl diester phosphodiesterase